MPAARSLLVKQSPSLLVPLVLVLLSCSAPPAPAALGTKIDSTAALARAAHGALLRAIDAARTPARLPPACPADMVEVAGFYCTELEQPCVLPRKPWQCAEFAPSRCTGELVPMRFCIDKYEYPNAEGAMPAYMKSWYDAKDTCEKLGKRLCGSHEWTLACEGPDRTGFPYGNVRDATACNFDKPSPRVDENQLFWPPTQQKELDRLDQREPSGNRARCVSAFGVFDLTGSVDEWTNNESRWPYRCALKGGNWGEYRNACRPATLGHDEGFHYYQTGFRCCRDADSQ